MERKMPLTKYSILKPNLAICEIKRRFAKPHPRCIYELAIKDNIAIRKYKKIVDSVDTILREYEWRFKQPSSIVHTVYVQLVNPSSQSKSFCLQVYVQDLEVSLGKMKQLLLPQAIYLIIRAVSGYKAIWERYKRISVDEQAVGLDSFGNGLVWLNPALDKNYPDQYSFNQPKDIVRELILLIKAKCQKVCSGVLQQLLTNLSSAKESNFQKLKDMIEAFVKRYQIKVPNNLRYIINQERLKKNCEDLRAKLNVNEARQSIKESSYNSVLTQQKTSSHKFIFSRVSLGSQEMRSPRVTSKYDKERILTSFRKTLSPNGYYRTLGPKIQQKDNHQSLDLRERANKESSLQGNRFYGSTVVQQEHQKVYHSRCKSQSFQWGKIVNNIRPKKRQNEFADNQTRGRLKQSDNNKTAQTFANNSKWSFNSQNSTETAKKILSPTNIVKQTPQQPIDNLYRCKQFQSYQCSPFIIEEEQITKINPSQQDSYEQLQMNEVNEVFLANKWTAKVKNLMSTRMQLNKSITDGNDTCNYLSEVKLDKLDTMMGKKMVISLLPSKGQVHCFNS